MTLRPRLWRVSFLQRKPSSDLPHQSRTSHFVGCVFFLAGAETGIFIAQTQVLLFVLPFRLCFSAVSILQRKPTSEYTVFHSKSPAVRLGISYTSPSSLGKKSRSARMFACKPSQRLTVAAALLRGCALRSRRFIFSRHCTVLRPNASSRSVFGFCFAFSLALMTDIFFIDTSSVGAKSALF